MVKKDKRQEQGWGGPWTEQKLECFECYVKAYLTIMNSYRDKFNWKLIYFDGFAGCGDRETREIGEDKTIDIFGKEFVSKNDLNLYQGAAERVARLDKMPGFDFYYFVDKFEENLERLELKLAKYDISKRTKFIKDDANTRVLQLASFMKKDAKRKATPQNPYHYKTLCLLDPFGMSIDWETIEQLAGNSLDLWILVPTGSIVSRLIQNDGKLRYPDTLSRFFGLPKEDIESRFFIKEQVQDLFGEHEETRKVKNAIEVISELYCERLGTLFTFVTKEPLVLRNGNNVPLFSFVCASNNNTAVKIAQQIINKRQ